MTSLKTKVHDGNVDDFIETYTNTEQKRIDSYELIKIMKSITGSEPKMWGPSMIGFGQYHYQSERSKQAGDWPLLAFSPRKTAISLYVYTGLVEHAYLLEGLGKFKIGKACIYVKRLTDINVDVLETLMKTTMTYLQEKYETI